MSYYTPAQFKAAAATLNGYELADTFAALTEAKAKQFKLDFLKEMLVSEFGAEFTENLIKELA